MADVTPHTINRRPFAHWAACATALIFFSMVGAMVLATILADSL